MSLFKFRARLAGLRGKPSVPVQPRLRVPTYAAFEQVCLLIGLDPEDVRAGKAAFREADLQDAYAHGPKLLALTCENASAIDLSAFERPAAEALVGVVLGHFFLLAMSTFEARKNALRSSLIAPEPTGSLTGQRARAARSGASSATSL